MGKDVTYRKLVSSKRWARLAMEMKVEAGWRCSACDRVVRRLVVHHVVPIESGKNVGEMERLCFDRGNLRVLCYPCHADVHRAERRTLKALNVERGTLRAERFVGKFTGEGEHGEK